MTNRGDNDRPIVSLGSLRQYLFARGWQSATNLAQAARSDSAAARVLLERRPSTSKTFNVFIPPGDNNGGIELVLPIFSGTRDSEALLRTAVNVLADVESRPMTDVLAAIRLQGVDLIRSSIPDRLVLNETVHLETARSYIIGIREVLAATATTEIEPEPFFLRVKKEATEYADKCRFGHTFRGSFGFTVESPVPPNNQSAMEGLASPSPFERRVVERFATGVQIVTEAARNEDPSLIVEHVNRGFSANACEQFADLVERVSGGSLKIDFVLSPEWKSELPRTETQFIVGLPHVEITRTAAKMLRTDVAPRPATVSGRIVRLESEADPSDVENLLGRREIAIQWSSLDQGELYVRAALNPVDYLEALRAHSVGAAVELSGTLEKKGRRWVLSSPSGLLQMTSKD